MYIFISISAIKVEEPECKVDQDCPSKLACISEQCQNPCILNNPCTGNQDCIVRDTIPIRTVACICPDGMVFTESGTCQIGKQIQKSLKYEKNFKLI